MKLIRTLLRETWNFRGTLGLLLVDSNPHNLAKFRYLTRNMITILLINPRKIIYLTDNESNPAEVFIPEGSIICQREYALTQKRIPYYNFLVHLIKP
jgi:hypothetical protein